MARVILDTGALVASVRDRLDVAAFAPEDDLALPAVALAEYLTRVELDNNPARQAAQRAFLDDLLAHVHRTGHPRGAHDLIIAATAQATGRVLVTTDAKAGFSDLPNVQVRLLKP